MSVTEVQKHRKDDSLLTVGVAHIGGKYRVAVSCICLQQCAVGQRSPTGRIREPPTRLMPLRGSCSPPRTDHGRTAGRQDREGGLISTVVLVPTAAGSQLWGPALFGSKDWPWTSLKTANASSTRERIVVLVSGSCARAREDRGDGD